MSKSIDKPLSWRSSENLYGFAIILISKERWWDGTDNNPASGKALWKIKAGSQKERNVVECVSDQCSVGCVGLFATEDDPAEQEGSE